MRALRVTLLAGLAFFLAAAAPRSVESTHLKIIVGVTGDDIAKWLNRRTGSSASTVAVLVTVPWKPGQMRATKLQEVYLHRIAR